MNTAGSTRDSYAARVAACEEELARLKGRSARMSTLRALTFLALVAALLVVDVAEGAAATAGLVVAAILVVVFGMEVAAHRRIRRAMAWQEALRQVSAQGILRLERRWGELDEALPAAEVVAPDVPADHGYARDLDVTGRASLARLAGPVTSERGRDRLHAWLLEPATPEEVARRQEAVRTLAPQVELRHAFAAHGRLGAAKDPPGTDRFLQWAEGDPWILERRGIQAAAWILPVILVSLGVADLFFEWPAYWILPALAHAWILRSVWSRLQTDFQLAEDGLALLTVYVPQLRLLEADGPGEGEILARVAERLGVGSQGAAACLQVLARRLSTVESRRNMFYAMVAPILLLDVHLTVSLDRWRRAWGPRVREWLEALGTWEALSSLATVAHDNPGWAFPVLDAGEGEAPTLHARGLGHPLLPAEECVCNDVEVGPPGTFLLVTGSNMSGKSTLLRALGANAVLAAAGAPVCARELRMPPVRVRTSMRIDDSLAQGVSLFMAELLRIRGIVEDADEEAASTPVLYLLDEILHGTNTAERRVAARAVIRHLLARDALGAVSTHDLTLAQAPDLEAAARPVHFRESVERVDGRTRLDFDYLLRPGMATTRNALKLLDAVGLGGLVGDEIEAEGDGTDA